MTTFAELHDPQDTALVRTLGHAGLIPFGLLALLLWLLSGEPQTFVSMALAGYAALIVSFLGGIHWGFAMRQSSPAISLPLWGVVPSLVAWVAVLMPPHAGLVLHGVMLVVCYLVDRRIYPAQGAAHWLTLRFRLSSVAALCCFLAAAGI